MKYCSRCGAALLRTVPAGDNRLRHVCSECETVHYENPKVVAGCLPVMNDKVLLCQRAIEPRYGYWTLPAGFMENDETLEQAAIRESVEEANALVEELRLYTVISLPHINQVYLMFLSRLADDSFSPGDESLAVALFDEQDIPWDKLAFRTISYTLKAYFSDRARGLFPVHNTIITSNRE